MLYQYGVEIYQKIFLVLTIADNKLLIHDKERDSELQ